MVSNAPQTYLLDGKQYVLASAGDALFAFSLAEQSNSGKTLHSYVLDG